VLGGRGPATPDVGVVPLDVVGAVRRALGHHQNTEGRGCSHLFT
jgi:hypothetical protein